MREKRFLVLMLIVGAVMLPLLPQAIRYVGYCLTCVVYPCPEGCVEGDELGRPLAVCATCRIDPKDYDLPPSYHYACTACNFIAIECKPVEPDNSCPPYRLEVRPFINVAGPRPFKCVLLTNYLIFLCVEE
ncbi:hypothetical protein M2350_003587 [Candidatus Fervidibacter sacchari]|jgi:hypothetical protein|uniref:4Fe-4S ferredoxin-type domain-containing protein n=1 Tax=Candidatus Fervidibacter sacchari TaxID=1448929 RepID=A0ABT2EUL4_9BACT|nr:hypothetical protein [Candidatus Fervidibacter sacchari]